MASDGRLRRVFVRALGLAESFDVEALEYQGIREWDSLAHMTLVAEIENEFEIMLDTDEVIGMSSFAKAREIVAEHLVEADV